MKRFNFKKAWSSMFLFLLLSSAAVVFAANSDFIEALLSKVGITVISISLGLFIPYSMLLTVQKALS